MKLHLVVLALVGCAYASTATPAWKENTEYIYLVNGRTFTSLHEVSNQYSGILLRAKLHIVPLAGGKLQARISIAEYAQVHSQLPEGWNTQVPDSELAYKQLDLSYKHFQIVLKDGLIKSLIVERDIPNWEANIIKSIVSQFQLDVRGKKVIPSQMNSIPKEEKFDGVFKTMEETITGETETTYSIHRLPEYLIQSEPWLVPQPTLKGDGQIIEIIKNKNFTNSNESPAYHYGFGDAIKGRPTYNRLGKFYSRQSNSRVILTGKPSRFTIQNSRTVNKIVVNPTLNAKEQGSVVSIVNVTLHEVKSQSEVPKQLLNPIDIGNLVYTYETPFGESNKVHPKQQGRFYSEDSSEQSREIPDQTWKKFRRSNEPMIRKMREDESYSSSSSSSSEEIIQHQSRPVLTKAPESPLLPNYMGYYGKSIKTSSDFDLKQGVKRIVQEISEEVQDPEKILLHSTLSKYVMLCSLTRLMDHEELSSVAEEIYSRSKQESDRLMWVVIRDSVAEAGTGPALLTIQQWIESGKIEKEEASEVISAMSNAVRVPTEEYIRKFFEIVKTDIVYEQEKLNETALLVYTSLLNKVYVNRNESYSEYPVYSFRNFYTKEGKDFMKLTVIPYLTQKLHDAVSQADSRKIHVYTRALGNVGHRNILKAFEPYLEGEKQVSQFQRMLMVLSLDKLVESDPAVARSVLYKIYQNTAEIPEVRVVAVYQLLMTNPPEEMVQRMAENTNTDSQVQVNAAVKSAIESASQLKSEEKQDLRKAAESAKPLLTRKEYGMQQSINLLYEFIVENMNLELHHNLLQVGSTDYNVPKGIKYGVRGNVNGMNRYMLNVQTMVSSIKELINVLYKQTSNYQSLQRPQLKSSDTLWSSSKIAELLNLQTNEREQLEGFVYTQMEHMHQLWSFDNETISQLPEVIREKEQLLKNGKEFSFIKLRQLKEMVLSVPTEMGFPFTYSYDQPIYMHFQGKINAIATPEISKHNKLRIPEQISAKINAFITVSTKVQSHLKVVTPFDHQMYIAGFDKNIQAHLPIKVKIEVDVKNHQAQAEFTVEENHKDARLLHYSSWPYTSRKDIMSLTPVALNSNTHLIKPQGNSHRSFDFVFGEEDLGMSFRVWGHHPQQTVNLLQLVKMLQSADISTIWQQVWDEASMHQTEATISLNPKKTSTRKVIWRIGHKEKYQKQSEDQQNEELCGVKQLFSKVEQDIKVRQQDMLKCIGLGIQSAKLHYFDTSLEFQGDQNYQHTFTLAYAKSNVAPESRLVAFYKIKSHKPVELALQVKSYIPNAGGLDLPYSLENKPKAKYEVDFHQRQWEQGSTKVKATFDLTRSEERKNYIERQPLYEVCKRQMQEGNRHLPACQNLTIESNYLDDIKMQMQYENIKKEYITFTENIFKGVRLFYYPMTEIRSVQSEAKNSLTMRVRFEPENLRKVNVTIRTKEEETKLFNLSISDMTRTVFVSHPVYHVRSRIQGKLTKQDNIRPTCVIDKNAAQTLSNMTYPLSLGTEWTLMMQYIPQQARPSGQGRQQPIEQLRNQEENFAVLVREPSSEKKEVKITFKHPETMSQTVEVTMQPKQSGSTPYASVLVDGKEVEFDDKKAAELFNGYVEIYALPSGEVKMEILDWFYIIFDGERVKLTATSDNLRDSIVGLCGRFSEDRYEDFWTPNNCIVRSAKKFAQSFVLEGRRPEDSQHQYQDCIPKVLPLYADVISEYDIEYTVEDRKDQNSNGLRMRSRYVEENGDICFTLYPVPVCENIPRDYTTKDIPVHCITKTKTAYYFKNQIDQGGNPDFSKKSQTKTTQMEIPNHC